MKVQEDFDNTGGYLILTSSNPDFSNGSDDWVEKESLAEYLKELGAVVWSIGQNDAP